jgi:hypothetical protein
MYSDRQNWSSLDAASIGRCEIWAGVFSEMIEILSLMLIKSEGVIGPSPPSGDRVFAGSHTGLWTLATFHFRQHLATKVYAVFGESGDASKAIQVAVAANGIILRWKPLMFDHARVLGADADTASELVQQLIKERNNLVGHKSGRVADLSQLPDGSIKYRMYPEPLSSSDVNILKHYFRACRDFVIHAALYKGNPAFPCDASKSNYDETRGQWSHGFALSLSSVLRQ